MMWDTLQGASLQLQGPPGLSMSAMYLGLLSVTLQRSLDLQSQMAASSLLVPPAAFPPQGDFTGCGVGAEAAARPHAGHHLDMDACWVMGHNLTGRS